MFNPEQVSAGLYLVLSRVQYVDDQLIVVTRGRKVQLVKIPTEILSVAKDVVEGSAGALVLEIKVSGDYKVPCIRYARADEMNQIAAYTDTEGTFRDDAGDGGRLGYR